MHWVATSEKDTDNATLEKRIGDAAEQAELAHYPQLKSQEYSGGRPHGPVLGLIFVRFAEVHFAARRVRLEKSQVLIPEGNVAEKFSALFAEILTQQQALIFQIQNLRRTRDLLLPRLLSGQMNPL